MPGKAAGGSRAPAQKPKKVKFYKGQPVMSDTEGRSPSKKKPTDDKILHDPDESSSSRSSHGSADEYFAATRNAVRQKLNIKNSKPSAGFGAAAMKSRSTPTDDKKIKKDDQESDSASEDDEAYNKRLEEERKARQEQLVRSFVRQASSISQDGGKLVFQNRAKSMTSPPVLAQNNSAK